MEGRAWHSSSPRLPRNRRHSDDLCVLQRRLRFSRASEGRKCLCRRAREILRARHCSPPCRQPQRPHRGFAPICSRALNQHNPARLENRQQLAKPLVLTAALAPPPEPRRFDVDQNLAANPPENASAEVVSGPVTEIRDAMTWVIGGRIVHLWGIRSTSRTPTPSLVRFADRMKAENPISCHRQPHSTRYRCFTASREDIAEMALLSGVGQPASGAPVAYRAAEVLTRGKGSRH